MMQIKRKASAGSRRRFLQTVGRLTMLVSVAVSPVACATAPAGVESALAQQQWEPYEAFAGAKTTQVDIDGMKLLVTDTGGTGEVMILLHAHTGSALNWAYQQRFFAAQGYRVITYSRRGYYGSPMIEGDDGPAIGSASADLYALAQVLELSSFHLLGTAAGGMVAADFAISHPIMLKSLTLASTLVGISDADYVAGTKRLLPKAFMQLPEEYKELSAGYILANPSGVEQWRALAEQSRPDPGLFKRRSFRVSANQITRENLAKLDIPTLVIAGDSDPYFPQNRARRVADIFPNGEYQLIPESGHSSYWEQYERFNAVLLAFLRRSV